MDNYKEIRKIYSDAELYDYEFADYKDDIYFWENLIYEYKPNSVIEIGCGTGRIARIVAPMVKNYTGLDFSSKFLDLFRKKFNLLIEKHKII